VLVLVLVLGSSVGGPNASVSVDRGAIDERGCVELLVIRRRAARRLCPELDRQAWACPTFLDTSQRQ
jgi:hypothetical protein